MSNNEALYRWIAIILGLALIVVIVMWVMARNNLETTLTDLENDVIDYRAEINEKCGPNSTAAQIRQNQDCMAALNAFASILRDYENKLQVVSTTTTPAATTTTGTTTR